MDTSSCYYLLIWTLAVATFYFLLKLDRSSSSTRNDSESGVIIVHVTIVYDDILPSIYVDTFHINYGTLDDNRFNNAITVVTNYSHGH